jgi:multidrug efflux pump
VPPAIRGLGQSNGFTMELQNTGGLPYDQFIAAREKLLAAASKDPMLASVRLSELPDVATLKVDIDHEKARRARPVPGDVNATLATAWGGRYVNDFVDRGRVKRVYVQGDAQYRAAPDTINEWFVRGSNGQMAPFSAFSQHELVDRADDIVALPGRPLVRIPGPGSRRA